MQLLNYKLRAHLRSNLFHFLSYTDRAIMTTFKGYYWIITSNKIVKYCGRLLSLGDSAMAITFFPFIFVRTDTRDNTELIRHETIHIRQQVELLIIGAWLLFIIEYCIARYIKKYNARQSYYYTALEQEAHRNAIYEDYLDRRKPYAMLKYIWNKKWLGRNNANELITRDY